jgi:hypothetical protein
MASAPSAHACRASASLVTPQIFTRTRIVPDSVSDFAQVMAM